MFNFTKRNLKVFFRDRSTVLFSLLGPFVVIGLYMLFLGDLWGRSYRSSGVSREMMDAWMLAGMLAVTSVTTSMGAFGTMIADRSRKIHKDFYCAPVRQQDIAAGYVLSTYLIGLILSFGTLVLAQLYMLLNGGHFLPVQTVGKLLLLLMLIVFANSALMFFVTTLLRSEHAFTTVSTVIGMLIGFLTGAFVPVGLLPDYAQWLVKLFSPSHAASLLRSAILEPYLEALETETGVESVNRLKQELGVGLSFGDWEMPSGGNLLVLLGTGAVFLLLAGGMLSRKQR